jgi:N-methylhydantoinase B/oxoprolinase/acetone carboxylase alpha subunit
MPAKATEIFHEGIRILGLKIVERGNSGLRFSELLLNRPGTLI